VLGLVQILRCIVRAAVRNAGRALASLVPLGEVGFEIARDAYVEYRQRHAQTQWHELAQATRAEVRQAAQQADAHQPLGPTNAVELALVSFLDHTATTSATSAAVNLPSRPREQVITIPSPQRRYALEGLLAAGDVADIHAAAADDLGAPPDERYVLKVSRGRQTNEFLDHEHSILANLQEKARDTTYRHYLPVLVESFATPDKPARRINVFRYEPGLHTLEQVHQQHPALNGRHLAWIFNRLLTVLGFCHRHGIVHGAVLPCHVLIHAPSHGLQLVGWGQSVRSGGLVHLLSSGYEPWYPPEVRQVLPASAATDLFLAARCMVYLAGGDPLRSQVPPSIPPPMRQFFAGCLLEGPRMRPDDAWSVQDEFGDMLRRVFGPPTFVPLTLT
jgi:serine/threonine protein kinase